MPERVEKPVWKRKKSGRNDSGCVHGSAGSIPMSLKKPPPPPFFLPSTCINAEPVWLVRGGIESLASSMPVHAISSALHEKEPGKSDGPRRS